MKHSACHHVLLLCAALAAVAAGCRVRNTGTAARIDVNEVASIRKGLGEGAGTKEATTVVADPTGWAAIRGTFKLSGSAPPRVALSVNKDQDICVPGGKQPQKEDLVVDANGGIKDVVIFCTTKMPAGDPKWEHPEYAASKNEKVLFDQKNCVFLTHMLAARTTQVIVLKNSDTKGHNANIVAKGKALSGNFLIAAGGSSDYTPGGESPEPFDVSCGIHPWMSAKMLTRDNPYFAVTKSDGTFEIKNVPAGVPLEFKVWQESSKFIQTVKLNGAETKWPKGKISLKDKDVLKPDEVRELNVTVDVAAFNK